MDRHKNARLTPEGREGMGVRRSGREDDGQVGDMVRDSQIHQQADGGLRDG